MYIEMCIYVVFACVVLKCNEYCSANVFLYGV